MILKKISLQNFRNYNFFEMEFQKKVYNIYGLNAQGKTNFLEAIYLTSYFRSFRTYNLKNCIMYDKDFFKIKNQFISDQSNEETTIYIEFNKQKKNIFLNNQKVKRISDVYGLFKVVIFSPYDFNLFLMGPFYRRRFFDMLFSVFSKKYLASLIEYKGILKKIKKILQEEIIDEELLEVYRQMIAPYSDYLLQERKQFINRINENINSIGREINVKENLELRYIGKNRGAHLDDYEFLLNGKNIEKFGSQGQKRTFLIALKLTILNLMKQITNEDPIFLMDDVFSELDPQRQRRIVEVLINSQIQVFITSVKYIDDSRFENIEISKWKN